MTLTAFKVTASSGQKDSPCFEVYHVGYSVCVCVCVYTNLGGLHLVACAAAPACEVGQDFTLLTIHTRLHLTPPLLSNYRCYTHTHTHHMEHGERPLMLVHNSKDTVTSSEYRGHIMEWGRKKKIRQKVVLFLAGCSTYTSASF